MQAPRIETKRLILKELQLHDAPTMYRYRSDPAVFRYQSWRPQTEEEVRQLIDNVRKTGFNVTDSWFQLGIYLQAGSELVGDLGLHFLPPDSRQVEIGFTIQPTHQRKGYASESLQAALQYLFTEMGKHRVIGSVDPANTASIALMEKTGMKREAHFRESVWTSEGWTDDLIYAVLEKEWIGKRVKG